MADGVETMKSKLQSHSTGREAGPIDPLALLQPAAWAPMGTFVGVPASAARLLQTPARRHA